MTWAAALSTAVCALGQVEAVAVEIETDGGIARGWFAEVELTHPDIEIVTLVEPSASSGMVDLVSPDAWLDDASMRLVVNASYFAAKPGGVASIVGVCVDDGEVVSPPRSYAGSDDPALMITHEGGAVIGHFGPDDLSRARVAVAGVGGSGTSSVAGSLLVDDGVNLGETARVQPMARHPRTAIGVSDDGSRLLIMVVDGRQDGWSVGVTLPELADALIERGAWDAVNLDGGGSSALLVRDGDEVVGNRPSDGSLRPVAVSLGIRMFEGEPASQAGGE